MIYCVWYPSGGFGHFINAVLTLHGNEFVRPATLKYQFSTTGDSHNLELVAKKYFMNPSHYDFNFDLPGIYTVLIDNGINDESKQFLTVFDSAQILKLCYSDYTWPIVSRTMIEKAMSVNFDTEVTVDCKAWPSTESWTQREKYFLFLRDNVLRHNWRQDAQCNNLYLDDFLNYQQLRRQLDKFGIGTTEFEPLWQQWYESNARYLTPVITATNILNYVRSRQEHDLTQYNDIWLQAVVYYYIWLEYQIEVPHNDYSNWFTNTKDIVIMLDTYGVLT